MHKRLLKKRYQRSVSLIVSVTVAYFTALLE